MRLVKKVFLFFCFSYLIVANVFAQKVFELKSPDQSILAKVSIDQQINFNISVDDKIVLRNGLIGLILDKNQREPPSIVSVKRSESSRTLNVLIPQKTSSIKDHFNQLTIVFKNDLSLEYRLYDDGFSWRWIVTTNGEYKVMDEKVELDFANNTTTWYPEETGFYSSNERVYKHLGIGEIENKLASLPTLFKSNGVNVLLTESDFYDYAGMWVIVKKGRITATFPRYPKETKDTSFRDQIVVSREDYIARYKGAHKFPWRILAIARADKDLILNQLTYQLASASNGNFDWVKPGKVVWDWWCNRNIYNVNFKAGINTETYRYLIDFAAANKFEYVLFDEGWGERENLTKINPDVDLRGLIDIANKKNVGILLWVSWLPLNKKLDETLDAFCKWGIKGVKIDFMQRDDQQMEKFYQRVCEAAAKRKLIVDFHSAHKPAGITRTFPNILTLEGARGNEFNKFDNSITTDFTTTLPFIRMQAGPMDFTPGSMRNVLESEFKASRANTVTMGTRCNQMAMFVIFESPLQMLCDSPTEYLKDEKWLDFLRTVPTVWENTYPLEGKVSEYLILARKAKNGDYYIGGMTNKQRRNIEVPLSFLPAGKYKMDIWEDGINAEREPKDYRFKTLNVDRSQTINIDLVSNGGCVVRLTKIE